MISLHLRRVRTRFMKTHFRTRSGLDISLPLFFPDATRGVVRQLDNQDLVATKTPGVLVNAYHLWREVPALRLDKLGGIRGLMGWKGAVISDSGGFQVMSLAKKKGQFGRVTDQGVWFKPENGKKELLTPEISVRYQLLLQTDLVVALDDFTPPTATKREGRETVERTILWAKQSKQAYEEGCKKLGTAPNEKPYLIGVVQGGFDQNLRKECAERLVEIGFDGLGYGGWPITLEGELDHESATTIARAAPKDYFLYGLGIGKPENIVECVKMGYQIFDCVLPTRDARHGRMYVFNAPDIGEIDVNSPDFYEYYVPGKAQHLDSDSPISMACDCHTCRNYSRAYLAHLFRIKDTLAWRLATIHNLRFYAILLEKLRSVIK